MSNFEMRDGDGLLQRMLADIRPASLALAALAGAVGGVAGSNWVSGIRRSGGSPAAPGDAADRGGS